VEDWPTCRTGRKGWYSDGYIRDDNFSPNSIQFCLSLDRAFVPYAIHTQSGVRTLKGEIGERWRKLCEQAAVEEDPHKLLELVSEINRLLAEKEERVQQQEREEPTNPTKRNAA